MKKWNERKFLYINGRLHKKLQTNKSDDLYVAQDTETKKIKTYSYRVVRDTHEKAFTTSEVSEMLGRSPRRIRAVIKEGHVTPQKQSYNSHKGVHDTPLHGNVKATGQGRCEYYFTEEDLYDIRDYFAHGSKYARTGKLAVPTKSELRQMVEQSVVLYVQNKKGEFVPTWQAIEF